MMILKSAETLRHCTAHFTPRDTEPFFQKWPLQFNKTPNQNSQSRILEVAQPQIWIPGFSPFPFPLTPKGGG